MTTPTKCPKRGARLEQAARRRSNRLRRALEKIITEYNFGVGKEDPYALVEIATLALTKDTNDR